MPTPAVPPSPDTLIRSLSRIAPTWRGERADRLRSLATGFPPLDALLPGGGWPIGALTEVILAEDGVGEVRLLLPALREMCHMLRRVALIDPPYTPDPPALYERGVALNLTLWIAARANEEGVWAACQLLREASTGAVLLWSDCDRDRTLRKLQLAAETGRSLAFLFRRTDALRRASPAALRLELRPANSALEVRVHKARGGRPGTTTVTLPKIRL